MKGFFKKAAISIRGDNCYFIFLVCCFTLSRSPLFCASHLWSAISSCILKMKFYRHFTKPHWYLLPPFSACFFAQMDRTNHTANPLARSLLVLDEILPLVCRRPVYIFLSLIGCSPILANCIPPSKFLFMRSGPGRYLSFMKVNAN